MLKWLTLRNKVKFMQMSNGNLFTALPKPALIFKTCLLLKRQNLVNTEITLAENVSHATRHNGNVQRKVQQLFMFQRRSRVASTKTHHRADIQRFHLSNDLCPLQFVSKCNRCNELLPESLTFNQFSSKQIFLHIYHRLNIFSLAVFTTENSNDIRASNAAAQINTDNNIST